MDGRAEGLRRIIALYRGYLAEGVSSELAKIYLTTITAAEAELRRLAAAEAQDSTPTAQRAKK
jgi:hypothetical protein